MKGPDEVLYAPVDELVTSMVPNRAPRKSRRVVEFPEADVYAGMEKLLVRTALIRAEGVKLMELPTIGHAGDAAELCKHLRYADQEYLVTLSLNTHLALLAIHEVGIGPADHVATSVQHLIKVGLLTGARAIIMVHNHPSGNPKPSPDDAKTTVAALKGCECVGLDLMDHVIVADAGWVSFAQTNTPLAEAAEHYEVTRFYVEKWDQPAYWKKR